MLCADECRPHHSTPSRDVIFSRRVIGQQHNSGFRCCPQKSTKGNDWSGATCASHIEFFSVVPPWGDGFSHRTPNPGRVLQRQYDSACGRSGGMVFTGPPPFACAAKWGVTHEAVDLYRNQLLW
jgi:hypothetical protein